MAELDVSLGKVVRIAGLEPARLTALPPQSSVSANSTICAHGSNNEAAPRLARKVILRRMIFAEARQAPVGKSKSDSAGSRCCGRGRAHVYRLEPSSSDDQV